MLSDKQGDLVREIWQTGILNAINDGVSIVDRDFRIIYQSQAHQIITGDSLGKNCYEVIGGEGHICEGCPVLASFQEGAVHALERQANINGNVLSFEISASAIKDSSGNIIAGIEILRDVTDKRKTEQTLMDAERKYRSLFKTSPDMIFITERNTGIIVDVNESACRLLGYSRDEIIGTVSGDRVVSTQKPSYEFEFEKLKTGGIYSGEYDVVCKDGSIIKVEVRGVAFDDYLFAIGRDITERDKFEEEIKNKVEELESFYEMAVGRETKMMELKSKIVALKAELTEYERHCRCDHIADKRESDV